MSKSALNMKDCGDKHNPISLASKTNINDVLNFLKLPMILAVMLTIFASCANSSAIQPNTSRNIVHQLPIATSNQLSSDGQDSSFLHPTSCYFHNETITAVGTLNGDPSESYVRYGDVVELYAYTSLMKAGSIFGYQVVNLSTEHPSSIGFGAKWQAEGTVNSQIGIPVLCVVAIQSTHAFMAAGNAGS